MCIFIDHFCFSVHKKMKLQSDTVLLKRCSPHIDTVSVEVDFSHFERTKHWFLSHGIEVQSHLNTIEAKNQILKKSPKGSFLLSVAQIISKCLVALVFCTKLYKNWPFLRVFVFTIFFSFIRSNR